MQNVFIVGSKGIPGAYGGFETFVDKLTEYHMGNLKLKYHVACKNAKYSEFEYHNARCFSVNVPSIGPAQAIYYDILALIQCCKYIKKNEIHHPIVYILACRIGPFASYFQNAIHKFGGVLYVNPDGHEWKRSKWIKPIRLYWKISEEIMVKHADLLICDSKNIEKYIEHDYMQYEPKTTFIAYGSETKPSKLVDDNEKYQKWLSEKGLTANNFYLVVGRFVPENNYETMILEFMNSKTKKDLSIITSINQSFLHELEQKLHFNTDSRIKFVGTVYDSELLKKIRENSYGYIHGHEVGGTNPSLLEALGSTNLNLILDVDFNREVAEDAALYWVKESGNLSNLLNKAEQLNEFEINSLGKNAKNRINEFYTWDIIGLEYEKLFLGKEK